MPRKEVRLNELRTVFDPTKWPVTADTDFSSILNYEGHTTYEREDLVLHVTTRHYPVYWAYPAAGIMTLPAGCTPGGYVNNTVTHHPAAIAKEIEQLREYAKTCQIISWAHGLQCPVPVADELPKLFQLRILQFGDDCPGSSETKTFPILHGFNAYIYRMFVWDYMTGAMTKDVYAARGMKHFYHTAGGPCDHVTTAITALNLTLDSKFDQLVNRSHQKLVFIGTRGWMSPLRAAFIGELATRSHEFDIDVELYGEGGMPMGQLPPGFDAESLTRSRAVVEVYANALLGFNYPMSSLFNGRLFDLMLTYTPQIIYDRHGELQGSIGMNPNEHYLAFDGTVDGLKGAVHSAQKDIPALKALAERAKTKAMDVLAKYGLGTQIENCLFDFVDGNI